MEQCVLGSLHITEPNCRTREAMVILHVTDYQKLHTSEVSLSQKIQGPALNSDMLLPSQKFERWDFLFLTVAH